MADNLDFPGPDDRKVVPPHEGDFPTDFFDDDDANEPSPSSPLHPAAVVQSQLEPEMHTAEGIAVRPTPPTPLPPAPADARRRAPVFPILLGALMLTAVTAAWFLHKQSTSDSKPSPSQATPTAANPAPPPDEPAKAAHAEVLAGDLKDVKSQVADLGNRLKALQGKVEALPKSEPAPDLKPIQGKLDELAKSVAAVVSLPEKLGKIDERVGAVDEAMKGVKDETAALAGQVKSLAAARAASAEPEPKPEPNEGATAMTQGRDLFRAGKYKEASEVFKTLEAGNPKDARVYYYAALARGASTSDWGGETVKLVTRGMELEKAGSPKASEIDTAFADMPAQLKPWLDAYRKRAR